jgi:hypothetical protein
MSKLWTPEPEFDKEELFASIEAEGLHIPRLAQRDC